MAGNLLDTVPVVGNVMKHLLLGGEAYSSRTLPRLYVLHAAVLPASVVLLLVIHITLVRLHGITEFEFEDEPEEAPKTFDFFPDHIYTELIIGLILMVVLSALATIQPAGLGPPADPLHTPSEIKPEWFFFATFRWLKIFPLTAAVLSMGLIVFAMVVWPWIDVVLRRIFKGRDVGFWIGVAVALSIVAMTVWEAIWPH